MIAEHCSGLKKPDLGRKDGSHGTIPVIIGPEQG